MSNQKDVSIVTGASRGIGRAIAIRLAYENHDIVLISRTESELIKVKKEIDAIGSNSIYFVGDVANDHFANKTIDEVLNKFEKIDHLVNNAGVGIFKKFIDSSLEEFKLQINTNLFGVYNFTKAVLPGMIKRNSGSIINISSLAGKNSFVGGTMYSSTKHALMGLIRSLMLEVREYNIRVVSICPGSVDTSFGNDSQLSPMNLTQILLPEDVAEMVATVVRLPLRALASEIDLRPTNPKK
jgi:3-oxoacyl-[acyl-carrier protein] reductase